MRIELPNPRPLSNNVDLEKVWYSRPEAIKVTEKVSEKPKTVIGGSNPVGGVMSGSTSFFNEDVNATPELLDVKNDL